MIPIEPVCFTEFADGLMRPVFEDARGRYVVDDEGDPVYGIWWLPPESNAFLSVEARPWTFLQGKPPW
jgi:hypothetical protein